MSGEESDEEADECPMTVQKLKQLCKDHDLYPTPEVNDVIYLNGQGFLRIRNLDGYTGLKVLWLQSNCITKIEGLSHLSQLRELYLQCNAISEMSGLEALSTLEVFHLSSNFITKIAGLESLVRLRTLEIDHNRLCDVEAWSGVLAAPSIEIINATSCGIAQVDVVDVLGQLPSLHVLRIDSNPFVRELRDYRRALIQKLPFARYLDDAPVNDRDRRLVAAWARGGRAAEAQERAAIRAEMREVEREAMAGVREMQRAKALADGHDLRQFPELAGRRH